jgi:thymidylate synthase
MFLAVSPQRSCARAWVQAAAEIIKQGDESYNVIIGVENPVNHDERDDDVIKLVDSFLKQHHANPIITIANTIFPQALYREHGCPAFFGEYHKVYDKLTKSRQWGRYFERMTRHKTLDGHEYNPLHELIDKLRTRDNSDQHYKAVYELAVYDPLRDRRYLRGEQCLSFLSFKLHPQLGLCLTAMYRNQTYTTRCLGNLIGLGRLQAFVAKEAGLKKVGPLTCISTHAELDTGDGWGIKDARNLVHEASRLLQVELVPVASR